MRSSIKLAVALAVVAAVRVAGAKEFGYRSPGGREIYDDGDTFGSVQRTQTRRLVIEVAVGAGPEGNVAALLGVLNVPVRSVDIFAGIGWELNPARHYTIGARYTANIDGYRPYIGLGYLYNDLYVLRTWSHNVFAEGGYCWVIHDTYRLTAGIGIRYIAHIGIRPDSPLNDPDVDPELLAEQHEEVSPWVPTFALRFSRAF
jgi:hypothetical protein